MEYHVAFLGGTYSTVHFKLMSLEAKQLRPNKTNLFDVKLLDNIVYMPVLPHMCAGLISQT